MRLYVTLLIEKHSLDELDTLDETTKKFAHRYLEM